MKNIKAGTARVTTAAHYGWTVVPFMKDGAERELEEKHEEIFSIIRSAL